MTKKEKELKNLLKQRNEIENSIKNIERQLTIKNILKYWKKKKGNYYKYQNKFIGDWESWYVYVYVRDVFIDKVNNNVVAIMDTYECNSIGEIKITIPKQERVYDKNCLHDNYVKITKNEYDKVVKKLTKKIKTINNN